MCRPREHDREALMEKMIAWAKLPTSLNINAFCTSVVPEIDPEYLREIVNKEEKFSSVYRIVKAYLATRREQANSDRKLSNQAYSSGLRHYDLFLKEDWKEERKFELEIEKTVKHELPVQQEIITEQENQLMEKDATIAKMRKELEAYAVYNVS